MFGRNSRICLALLLSSLAGCAAMSVPAGVDPLPYYRMDRSTRNTVHTLALCKLYAQYGFTDGECSDDEWTAKMFTDEELASDALRSARNEVQHTILGVATTKCNEFKRLLTARARGQLLGAETLALLFSAGAAFADTEQLTKGLAAAAGAFTGFSNLMENGYTDDLETTVSGIEIARTRIFYQILGAQEDNLLDYPLSRAVNDAMRYHAVCNLEEGISEVSRALSEELAEIPPQEAEQETAPTEPADFMARGGDTQVTLRATTTGTVTKWQYRQREGDSGTYAEWTDIDNSASPTLDFAHTGLTNETTYYYQVRAMNGEDAGAESDERSATPSTPP